MHLRIQTPIRNLHKITCSIKIKTTKNNKIYMKSIRMSFTNNRLMTSNKNRNNHKIMKTNANSSMRMIFMILNPNKTNLNRMNLVAS